LQIRISLYARLQDCEYYNIFALYLIRLADDCSSRNSRMLFCRCFDLCVGYPVACYLENIVPSSQSPDVTILVDPGFIS